uniref:Uncharacterized protein n=1 Tax=Pyxicephalus adspersus TaxID=30357 RepID=A0AAV2ZFV4_PYXAD|nr:TPA: hypothetical protein GDO54_004723 [Pyxicephalus adspersus]
MINIHQSCEMYGLVGVITVFPIIFEISMITQKSECSIKFQSKFYPKNCTFNVTFLLNQTSYGINISLGEWLALMNQVCLFWWFRK